MRISKQLMSTLDTLRLHVCPICQIIYDCKKEECCNSTIFQCPLHYDLKNDMLMTEKDYLKLINQMEFFEPVFIAEEVYK